MAKADKGCHVDTDGQTWAVARDGWVHAIWGVDAAGGMFTLAMQLPPGVVPLQSKAGWLPTGPVQPALDVKRATRRVAKRAKGADIIDFAAYRRSRAPHSAPL